MGFNSGFKGLILWNDRRSFDPPPPQLPQAVSALVIRDSPICAKFVKRILTTRIPEEPNATVFRRRIGSHVAPNSAWTGEDQSTDAAMARN